MSKQRWIVTTGMFLMVFLMAAGYFAIAAEYGSQTDPLVSLSYITDVLSPETLSAFEEKANARALEIENGINTRIEQYSADLNQKLEEFETQYANSIMSDEFINKVAAVLAEKQLSGTQPSEGSAVTAPATTSQVAQTWSVVKLESGKKMLLPLGSEVILRFGSAKCYSTGDVGLINITTGKTVANGEELSANNLYLVSIASGRGITATSDVTVLVSGSYTIE